MSQINKTFQYFTVFVCSTNWINTNLHKETKICCPGTLISSISVPDSIFWWDQFIALREDSALH